MLEYLEVSHGGIYHNGWRKVFVFRGIVGIQSLSVSLGNYIPPSQLPHPCQKKKKNSCSVHLVWVEMDLELQLKVVDLQLRPSQLERFSLCLWDHELHKWYRLRATRGHHGATRRKPVWDWNKADANRAQSWRQSSKTSTALPTVSFTSWTIHLGQSVNPPFQLKPMQREG